MRMSAKPFMALAALAGTLVTCCRLLASRSGCRRWQINDVPASADSSHLVHVLGLTKQEAEDLLDWLEGQAVEDRRVSYTAEKGFCVSYRTEV
jgi:hypothetical protein